MEERKMINMKNNNKKNSLEIVRRAADKLASSKLVRARLWEREAGKERLYIEPTSQEAVREAAGYCSKADLRRMSGAYVEASTLSFHGLTEDDAPRAVQREVQAAITEAEAELDAESSAAAPITEDDLFELDDEELAVKAAALQAAAASTVEEATGSFDDLEPETAALEPLPSLDLEAMEAHAVCARSAVRTALFASGENSAA